MAKKKINILLILVVLGLWGTVGYRALNRRISNDEVFTGQNKQSDNNPINQINKDTFELKECGRDPFLNKQFQGPAITIAEEHIPHYSLVKKVISPPVKTKTVSDINWPVLTYYGYIESKERNENLILLKIDSKLYKLKLNYPVNGLIVKKIYKDSIEVHFNSQIKIIKSK